MSEKKVCKKCQEPFEANPRLKGKQYYCSKEECQRARKSEWERLRNQNDPIYRERQRASKKRWRKKYPVDEYQRQYRLSHPEYVKSNRKLQKKRNEKVIHQPDAEPEISYNNNSQPTIQDLIVDENCKDVPLGENCKDGRVNSESIIPTGLYAILPYNSENKCKIVKMDALIVQLTNFHESISNFVPNSS